MKAIVLAAGYATRLRPLTEQVPKPLLPLAGRPMLDYLCDKLDAVGEIDAIHVVTNGRFAPNFVEWAAGREGRTPVRVHDDGTTTNETRLGATGDIRFVLDEAGIRGHDLLVVAGDNLFDYDLTELVAFWHAKGEVSAISIHDVGELALAAHYAVVELDDEDRIVSLVEKPELPQSTLAATATYVFAAPHAALIDDYLEAGNPPDPIGLFPAWLYRQAPVYGYRFAGDWLDIGDREQLLEADNRLRARAGLEPRAAYVL
jgi:glucose-1-phosphate thymidylyltransferase